MPIRIYTNSPARQLMDDRPFGLVAWTDGSHLGEVYAIAHMSDGTPRLRGTRVTLTSTELEGSIEHAMRLHLGKLWRELPEAQGLPFEELREEIPVEEFALTQINKPSIKELMGQVSMEAQSEDLANAFATFRHADQ